MAKQIWVTPTDDGWKVKQPDNSKASALTWTKAEAMNTAKQIAQNQWLEMIWQTKDWKIQWRNSYWNDPFPPKW